MSIKVILTGSFGVGKSSLFDRFIYDEFSDKYFGTIGVRVNSKDIVIKGAETSIQLWDVAGEVSQSKLPASYFDDKQYIIYMVDLTRKITIGNAPSDIEFLQKTYPKSEVIFVGNKSDLLLEDELDEINQGNTSSVFDWIISAKSGKNISELFNSLSEKQLNLI